MVCVNEVPCIPVISTVKSPSSSVGMNSPPIVVNIPRLTKNSNVKVRTIVFLNFNVKSRTGL
ncbi:hypothetical protein D3C84_1193560 [compost metagenome]